MSSPAEPITTDNNQSTVPTEGNEVILDVNVPKNAKEDAVASGADTYDPEKTVGVQQPHRLHETETVGGFQEEVNPEAKLSILSRYLGIVLALLSILMFSFTQTTQKVLLQPKYYKIGNKMKEETFGPFNMAAWTFPFQIVFVSIILIYYTVVQKQEVLKAIRPFRSHRKTLLLIMVRSIANSGGLILFYIGLGYLDLADAVVIISCVPIFVHILCRIFLKEPVGYLIIGTSMLAIGGVVVMSVPHWISGKSNFKSEKLLGIMFTVLAMCSLSISMVTVRFMTHVFHGLLTIMSYCCGSVLGIVFALAFNQLALPKNLSFSLMNEYFLLVMIAAMTVAAQTLLVMALQHEKAGPVALILTLGVFLGFLWQIAFLEKQPNIWSAIGGVMIVVGVVVTIFRKWMTTLPEDNLYRRRFAFLLK